jgi:hypothetical protein
MGVERYGLDDEVWIRIRNSSHSHRYHLTYNYQFNQRYRTEAEYGNLLLVNSKYLLDE